MEKMTYVKALEIAISTSEGEVKEKLEALKASLVKKSSAERKPTAKQTENEGLKEVIVAYLGTVGKATISEMIKGVPALEGMTNQRVSAIVRQLKDSGAVIRTEEKRVAYFSLPEIDEE